MWDRREKGKVRGRQEAEDRKARDRRRCEVEERGGWAGPCHIHIVRPT